MSVAKVIILRPVLQFIHVETQHAINQMKQHCHSETDIKFSPNEYDDVFLSGSQIVHKARNGLIKGAMMHKDWTHALFIDDDMVFPPESLEALVKHGKDITGVCYMGKTAPFNVNVFFRKGEKFYLWNKFPTPGPPRQVDAVGFGLVLVKREVLEKIGDGAFHFGKYAGEDISFCQTAKEAGFETWVDTQLEVGHVGRFVYNRHYLDNYNLTADAWLNRQMAEAMGTPKSDPDEMPDMNDVSNHFEAPDMPKEKLNG